jgi:phospholipase C
VARLIKFAARFRDLIATPMLPSIPRRLGLLLLIASAGCKRHAPPQPVAKQARPPSYDWTPPPPSATPSASAAKATPGRSAAARRDACEFTAGALPEQTLAEDEPIGQRIPIDHFVIVMQENRSFDHYFQGLPKFGVTGADVAPPDYHNFDPRTGHDVKMFHQTALCAKDVRHDWNSAHVQYGDGKMDGFVGTSDPHGERALGYYEATELPYYYQLASTFAIGDRYFASILGPTWPNRMFFNAASTFGHIGNTAPPPQAEEPSLFHQLQQKGIEWVVYAEGMTFEEKIFRHLHEEKGDHFKDIDGYFEDAKKNTLPAYVWVESSYGGPDATDEHPPADVELGQELVSRVIDALMKSSAWAHSALFIMYDEPGGFFDHVPPPPACPPDAIEPLLEKRHLRGRFDRLGMRVPFIVVSPFAKAHYVSHQILSHTSVLRMVQARFGLPALSARDANSDVPYDLFDFEHPPFLVPPTLPPSPINEALHKVCQQKFRKKKKAGKTVDVPDYGTQGPVSDPEGPPDEPATP